MAKNGVKNLKVKARPKGRARERRGMRARATNVLANGVTNLPRRIFGRTVPSVSLACWDAKMPQHLSLPRSVGPYTTIRVTRRVNINSAVNVIGTFRQGTVFAPNAGDWSEIIMISDVNAALPINGVGNTQAYTVNLGALGEAATLVPSALTVQMMCPTALNTASGIVYAGVMNTQAAIAGRPDTWAAYADNFVQFQSPRLLAASKLALRGVQINSFPLSMSQVSEFTPLQKEVDGIVNYDNTQSEIAGWAPIVIYNPGSADLELLISVEYRVRFDLAHPASASHSHHPIASDRTWDGLMRKAVSLGNGVCDIVETVANAGQAFNRVFGQQALPMLVD